MPLGTIEELRLPEGIRVDAGVEEGDIVGTRFDPLLAKLIAHAETREGALALLEEALGATVVRGVRTNLPFLRWLVAHPAVRRAETTTRFLDDHPPLSRRPPRPASVWEGAFRLNLPRAPVLPPPRETATARDAIGGADAVTAPMAGTVIAVDVEVGDTVQKYERLAVLEAMKMEMPVTAPHEAVVEAVHVAAGATVSEGDVLVDLAALSSGDEP